MKKKFRDIVVDGEKYAWQAKADPDFGAVLKIWHNKKVILNKKIVGELMIPSYVAEVIKNLKGGT